MADKTHADVRKVENYIKIKHILKKSYVMKVKNELSKKHAKVF